MCYVSQYTFFLVKSFIEITSYLVIALYSFSAILNLKV